MASTDTDTYIDTRNRPGRCPEHGDVVAEKRLPKLRFPFFVWGIRRLLALLGPYRCPTCGAKA
jgi:hypothetical protein